MPRIKNGPPAAPPIKDERRVENQGNKGTRDRAEYDNGSVRYDWDVYKDAQGDHRGKIGLGHDDGTNDIYGRMEFNEDSGHLKGSVTGERHINENVDVRGGVGRYADGDNFGELGATVRNDRGSLDVDVGANERTNRRFGKLRGRYRVGDDTTLRGAFNRSVKTTKSEGDVVTDTWNLGARHRVGVGITLTVKSVAIADWVRTGEVNGFVSTRLTKCVIA